jgi:hypothetical protein
MNTEQKEIPTNSDGQSFEDLERVIQDAKALLYHREWEVHRLVAALAANTPHDEFLRIMSGLSVGPDTKKEPMGWDFEYVSAWEDDAPFLPRTHIGHSLMDGTPVDAPILGLSYKAIE